MCHMANNILSTVLPKYIKSCMEFDTADLGRAQHDIGNVITARVGIESDKISERRVSKISESMCVEL